MQKVYSWKNVRIDVLYTKSNKIFSRTLVSLAKYARGLIKKRKKRRFQRKMVFVRKIIGVSFFR